MVFDGRKAGPLPSERRQHFRKLFVEQACASFLNLSLGMGAVAFMLPIAVVVAGGYHGHYSISYFYYVNDTSRSLFVGGLWATGVFLFLFRGLSRWENRLLNVAGIFGIGVSMFPMGDDQSCDKHSGFDMHATCAILFFACLGIVAICLSKERIKDIPYDRIRKMFKRWYNGVGAAMIILPAMVIAIHLERGSQCETHWIYWIETFGIWAFATYWFVKTAEYRLLLGARVRPLGGTVASPTIDDPQS